MRIAHCSDLHLLSHDGAKWISLANKRWIGALNLLSNRSRHYHVDAFDDMVADFNAQGFDHVLCTGDVTNLALAQEFDFARDKFDRLALGPRNVTVIPGNHDAYVAEGIPLFHEAFAQYAETDPGWEWTDDRPAGTSGRTGGPGGRRIDHRGADDDLDWPIVRIRGDLALVGVSTSRATPWFTAYGRVGDGQLARLRRALLDDRLRGKRRLVAIHHPPAGKRAASKIRGLRDHAAFAEVIAETGADLIVHGHEHRDMVESLPGPAGPVPVRGVASGTYCHNKPDRVARYRVFELANGAFTDHVRIWDRTARRFAVDDGTPRQSSSGA